MLQVGALLSWEMLGQVRWVPGGHVSAFLLQQPAFRRAILDSLDRLAHPAEERVETSSAAKAA